MGVSGRTAAGHFEHLLGTKEKMKLEKVGSVIACLYD
jgi:hypothetical protein